MKETLGTLFILARNLNAALSLEHVRRGISGNICETKIIASEFDGIKMDIKITIIGGTGAGKSTLLGVLISGKVDNGEGYSR
jgi:elongation factor 1-alpha